MNCENRLSGQSIENLTPLSLTDIVSGMTARSRGIVAALQASLSGSQLTLCDGEFISALEAVNLELADIQSVVQQFHQIQKEDLQVKEVD